MVARQVQRQLSEVGTQHSRPDSSPASSLRTALRRAGITKRRIPHTNDPGLSRRRRGRHRPHRRPDQHRPLTPHTCVHHQKPPFRERPTTARHQGPPHHRVPDVRKSQRRPPPHVTAPFRGQEKACPSSPLPTESGRAPSCAPWAYPTHRWPLCVACGSWPRSKSTSAPCGSTAALLTTSPTASGPCTERLLRAVRHHLLPLRQHLPAQPGGGAACRERCVLPPPGRVERRAVQRQPDTIRLAGPARDRPGTHSPSGPTGISPVTMNNRSPTRLATRITRSSSGVTVQRACPVSGSSALSDLPFEPVTRILS